MVCLVRGGRWRNVLARQQLMNTIRTYSRPLCQIHRCHHQTFLQAKSHHSLLQQDLQCCHNLSNNHCSLHLSPLRRLEHVSSIGCLSHTRTGQNIHMDQSGMARKHSILGTHFYMSLHCMYAISTVNGEGRYNCVHIVSGEYTCTFMFGGVQVIWFISTWNNLSYLTLKFVFIFTFLFGSWVIKVWEVRIIQNLCIC